MRVNPIGYLEPGKIYVIRALMSQEHAQRLREHLEHVAVGCKFVVLDPGMELLTAIPAEEERGLLKRIWARLVDLFTPLELRQ